MGFGNTHLQKLRKVGRKVVLPTDEIQAILESKIDFSSLTTIVDFGAGTLFWSEYFASKLDNNAMGGGQSNNNHPNHPISQPNQPNQHVQLKIAQKQVIAIDSIYQNSPQNLLPKTSFSNIIFASDIFQILESKMCDMFFASDVLHHLGLDFYHALFNALTQAQTQWIVIKDIDANYTFGNFANTMHDLLINGERVRKIYPQQIQTLLESKGYKTWKFFLPKLWYPHFLLLAHLQPNNKI